MPAEILLVRHGQTASNVSKLYMGRSQEDLNETGLAQARKLAARISAVPISAVYSSPLKRARTTAQILADPHQLSVKTEQDLVEIDLGEWEGLPLEEVRQKWPDTWKGWRERPSQESIPGGESFSQAAVRAVRALEQIIAENPNRTSLIVSHEIILKIMVMKALNADFNLYRRFVIGNASLSRLEFRANWLRVISVNDSYHLEGLN
jgi:broad specificity phosphatase PhoE